MKHNAFYTLLFAFVLSIIAGTMVATTAVMLHDQQQVNVKLEIQRAVLLSAGLASPTEPLDAATIEQHFTHIRARVIDMRTGEVAEDQDPESSDAKQVRLDPSTSHEVPENAARVDRVPHYALIYEILDPEGRVDGFVLPVEGSGLWSTLYGFLAIAADGVTIRGLKFYQHGETPGLGGEVDNPLWQALWPGRKAYDEQGMVRIAVIKGPAGPAESDPYHVDGLSGATLTSRGVTNLLAFWLGDEGFGPFLARIRSQHEQASQTASS